MKNLKYLIFVLLFFPLLVSASAESGTIDSTYKYAWGNYAGWINFGATNGGVTVTDSALTGYAWSDNYGWINLSPDGSGVTNNNNGDLSGYAWSETLGWVNFTDIAISETGVFSGTAAIDNSFGVITFDCDNCDVRTDWRPVDSRGGGYNAISPTNTSVLVNNGASETASTNVNLVLGATGANRMIISNSSLFTGASWEGYVASKSWDLTAGLGPKTVYVRYKNSYGNTSGVITDSIILSSASDGGGGSAPVPSEPSEVVDPEGGGTGLEYPYGPGSLIKLSASSAVYYVDSDYIRRPFMDSGSYFSWYSDFSTVVEVTLEQIALYDMGNPMLYKAGGLLKIQTVPKVYLLSEPNVLHWITTEKLFNDLGYNFDQVRDVPDAFWGIYTVGDPIISL